MIITYCLIYAKNVLVNKNTRSKKTCGIVDLVIKGFLLCFVVIRRHYYPGLFFFLNAFSPASLFQMY